MNIVKNQNDGKITLILSGKLDTVTAPDFQNVLIPAFDEAKEIVLDFTQLAYVSSAGLRVLLMGEKAAKSKNASMTVSNVSDEIMEVFEMTGFSDMLTIVRMHNS